MYSNFCSHIISVINRAKLDKTILRSQVKHKIQEFSIHFSKNLSKARAHLEDELELNNLYNRSEMDNETKLKILSLESKIGHLYIRKAKGM